MSVSDGSAAWEDVRKAVSPWRRWSELSPLQQLDARYDHPGVEWAAYWWRWYDDRWQVGTPVELGVPPRYIG